MVTHHKSKPINLPKICAVTLPDDPNLLINIEIALRNGIKWIQYRAKNKSRKLLFQEALQVKILSEKFNALLTINDYVDVAIIIGATSIHLGQQDLPCKSVKSIANNMIIGISTHNIEEAKEAQENGADYIGFGSVFITSTKEVGTPKGIEALKDVLRTINIPVVAIGGINIINIRELLDNDGMPFSLAMSSGIFKGDIAKNCQRLVEIGLL